MKYPFNVMLALIANLKFFGIILFYFVYTVSTLYFENFALYNLNVAKLCFKNETKINLCYIYYL